METNSASSKALADFDWDRLDDIEFRKNQCFENMMGQLNVDKFEGWAGLKKSQFNSNKAKKEELAFWLEDAVEMLEIQSELLSCFKNTLEIMKTDLIADQAKLISTQEQLLDSQRDQLSQFKSAVETTVQNTVEKEIKSYSEVVGNQNSEMGSARVQETVREAVKSAIQEDDRSRNVIIFGLVESEKEQIDSKVAELFAGLGENTRISASRIGVTKSGSVPCRPVKCTLSNTSIVHQILLKSRRLKMMDKYKSVYICPDRTPEERAARRALVTELKSATANQPNFRHFIKNGKLHSEKK